MRLSSKKMIARLRRPWRFGLALAVIGGFAGASIVASREPPVVTAEDASLPADRDHWPASRGHQDDECYASLLALDYPSYRVDPRKFSSECPIENPVAVREPLREKRYASCRLALTFLRYFRSDLQPLAQQVLGKELLVVGDKGVRACRPVANSKKSSQHTFANAIDLSEFVFDDGSEISVETHWDAGDARARFLHAAARAACERFSMVITPDYNEAHRDHLHLDMGGRSGCKLQRARSASSTDRKAKAKAKAIEQ